MGNSKVLVTGGAGYIGSHAVRFLVEAGYEIVVVDDLSQGHANAVHPNAKFYEHNILDTTGVQKILSDHRIDVVMHFAAFSRVADGESDPATYYKNNVGGTLSLLEAMRAVDVKRMVFSSTAAVYGLPDKTPIDEEHPCRPINVYGRTKLMLETILDDYRKAYGFGYVILRYFNAAGAWPGGIIGEDHDPESHLIPRVLDVSLGRRAFVGVNGNDYPTSDGTCVRDYVHVVDLADAHALALKKIRLGKGCIYNIGSEAGFSVMQVIQACEAVTGKKIEIRLQNRRPGDPTILIASQEKIKRELVWNPKHSDLRTIITHAWEWHQKFKGRPLFSDL